MRGPRVDLTVDTATKGPAPPHPVPTAYLFVLQGTPAAFELALAVDEHRAFGLFYHPIGLARCSHHLQGAEGAG